MQLVSVLIITFNAQKYVIECLESIERQTYQEMEIIISDDASSDETTALIKQFQQKSNRVIKLQVNHHRQGTYKNLKTAMDLCNGSYIAYLEGDDYWTDPEKISKQIKTLHEQKNFVAIATQSYRLSDAGLSLYRKEIKDQYNVQDILGFTPFHSSTFFFERSAIDKLPLRFEKCISNDKTLYLLCAIKSPILFFNEVTSVYRMHSDSISGSGRFLFLQLKQLQWLWHANLLTRCRYAASILQIAWNNHLKLMLKYLIREKTIR